MKDFDSILQAGLKGDKQAIRLLEQLIERKKLTEKEIARVIRCCDADIKKNNISAIIIRAWLYEDKPQNYSAMIALYDKGIALGDSTSMNNRAWMYQYGKGEQKNYSAAIKLYEQAIKLGNASAMSNLAFMYKNAIGVTAKYSMAIQLYENAITLGESNAMFMRAIMHEFGIGGAIDYPRAIILYETAIALGHAEAMVNRASMHLKGKGGPVNNSLAIKLLDDAVLLNNDMALFSRASLYETGKGSAIDLIAAAKLYRRASLNDELSSLCKNAFERLRAKDRSFEICYQEAIVHVLVDNDTLKLQALIKSHPIQFSDSLANDNLMTTKVEEYCVTLLIKNNLKNQTSINVIGKFYLNKANAEVQNHNFDYAISLYHKVPRNSLARGDACYGIAIHIYGYHNPEIAFEMARPYLEEGMALQNQDCKELYLSALLDRVDPNGMIKPDYDSFDILKNSYIASMTLEQKTAALLSNFIVKHHLVDLDYWNQQSRWFETKKVDYHGKMIEIPTGIAAMHKVVNNKKMTPEEKIVELQLIATAHQKSNWLFSQPKILVDCYEDTNNLSRLNNINPCIINTIDKNA